MGRSQDELAISNVVSSLPSFQLDRCKVQSLFNIPDPLPPCSIFLVVYSQRTLPKMFLSVFLQDFHITVLVTDHKIKSTYTLGRLLYPRIVNDYELPDSTVHNKEMTSTAENSPDTQSTFSATFDYSHLCSWWTEAVTVENVDSILMALFLAAEAEAWGTAISLCYCPVSDDKAKNPKTFLFPTTKKSKLSHKKP